MKLRLVASFAALLLMLSNAIFVAAQDQDADKKPQNAPASPKGKSKKGQSKEQPKDEKKAAPAEEKKGGMTADTFSGLKFRSLGPAVASGRVMSIAVNPRNKLSITWVWLQAACGRR